MFYNIKRAPEVFPQVPASAEHKGGDQVFILRLLSAVLNAM